MLVLASSLSSLLLLKLAILKLPLIQLTQEADLIARHLLGERLS